MAADFNKAASDFLNTPSGKKIAGKKDDLEKLIGSPEGQNVRNMMRGSEQKLVNAIENNDTETLRKALSDILKTEDGSKIAEQLIKLMN